MYNICISIIYVYSFYEAQATLLRRRKQVTMFRGGHTDYCWKRRVTRERGEGAYCRSETGVSMVQIDLQGKHLLNILHFVVYNVFIVAVFIEGDHLCEGLEVTVAHKAPEGQIVCTKQSFTVVCEAHCGIESLDCKRTKRCS